MSIITMRVLYLRPQHFALFLFLFLKVVNSLNILNASTSNLDTVWDDSSSIQILTKQNFKVVSTASPPDALARYAFTYHHNQNNDQGNTTNSANSSSTNSTSGGGGSNMAATAIVDIMSHIQDPFKHGVTAALLAGLYVLALVSLIVFATTGTIAFICSFVDCRNFFLGTKPDSSPRRRGNIIADRNENIFGSTFSGPGFWKDNWSQIDPILHGLQEYDGNANNNKYIVHK